MRTDTEKPIPTGTKFKRDGVTYEITSFVNCTPKATGATESFWDYRLLYKDGKEEKELCVDSNHLAKHFKKV